MRRLSAERRTHHNSSRVLDSPTPVRQCIAGRQKLISWLEYLRLSIGVANGTLHTGECTGPLLEWAFPATTEENGTIFGVAQWHALARTLVLARSNARSYSRARSRSHARRARTRARPRTHASTRTRTHARTRTLALTFAQQCNPRRILRTLTRRSVAPSAWPPRLQRSYTARVWAVYGDARVTPTSPPVAGGISFVMLALLVRGARSRA